MKYKICKYKNGLGEEWFQIKIKFLGIFWYNYEQSTYANYDYSYWEFAGDRFPSKESAQQKIQELIDLDRQSKIQLINCEPA